MQARKGRKDGRADVALIRKATDGGTEETFFWQGAPRPKFGARKIPKGGLEKSMEILPVWLLPFRRIEVHVHVQFRERVKNPPFACRD